MPKKASQIRIIDATTKKVPEVLASEPVQVPLKSNGKKTSRASQKASLVASKKGTLKSAPQKSQKVRGERVSSRDRIPLDDAPTPLRSTAPQNAVPLTRTRRKFADGFRIKIRRMTVPEIRHARMRAVAYIGVTYVLIGVCAASYALAGIYAEHAPDSLFAKIPGVQKETASTISGTMDTTLISSETSAGGSSGSGSGSGEITTTSGSGGGTMTMTTTPTSNSGSGGSGSGTSTTSTTTSSGPTTTVAPTLTATLTPEADFLFSESMPFSEKVSLIVKVADAEKVELGAMPQSGLTTLYLGKANHLSGSLEWRFVWDTHNVPNGGYYLGAHITNRYGSYNAHPKFVTIFNPTASASTSTEGTTVTAPNVVTTVQTIETEMASTLTPQAVATSTDSGDIEDAAGHSVDDVTSSLEVDEVQPTVVEKKEVQKEDTEARTQVALAMQMDKFKENLLALIERYAVAYRAGDAHAETYVKGEIENLKQQAVATLRERQMVVDGNYDRIAHDLEGLVAQELARIETRERMIHERVQDAVAVDTDGDGIVDYDEVHLYHTDPKSADTDTDGFPDGAEVMSGYNPTDPKGQTAVAFEDPQTHGPAREDILTVATIATEKKDDSLLGARFSGTGLPNSFVTLYIFSTPVVVTVRTGEDGSWSYVFDKELENGAHTVYVGMTDNAGRIVAKSKPFPFVKTAEAFTGATAVAHAEATPPPPELISSKAMLLIVAILIVMLGAALIALGSYFMRPREYELVQSGAPTPA